MNPEIRRKIENDQKLLELVKEFFHSDTLSIRRYLMRAAELGIGEVEARYCIRLYLEILGVLSHDGALIMAEY